MSCALALAYLDTDEVEIKDRAHVVRAQRTCAQTCTFGSLAETIELRLPPVHAHAVTAATKTRQAATSVDWLASGLSWLLGKAV